MVERPESSRENYLRIALECAYTEGFERGIEARTSHPVLEQPTPVKMHADGWPIMQKICEWFGQLGVDPKDIEIVHSDDPDEPASHHRIVKIIINRN